MDPQTGIILNAIAKLASLMMLEIVLMIMGFAASIALNFQWHQKEMDLLTAITKKLEIKPEEDEADDS